MTKTEYFKWLNGHRKKQIFLAIISAYVPKQKARFICRMNITNGLFLTGGKLIINGIEFTITIRSSNYYSTLAQLKALDFGSANVTPYLFQRQGAKTFHIGFKSTTNTSIAVSKSTNDEVNTLTKLGISVGTYYEKPATETQMYVSSQPYSSTSNDSPANQQFAPIIKSIPYQRRTISIFAAGSKQDVGELVLNNDNGNLDYWASLYFKGKQIIICLGDPEWSLTDMTSFPLFVGAVKNEPNELNPEIGEKEVSFRFGDVWQELNIPIQEQFITTGGNIDKPVPIILGKCQNLSPILVDSATQTYALGGTTAPSKIYEGGNDVTYNWNFTNGKITPNDQQWKPFYEVTCDVTTPTTKAIDLIQYLVSKNNNFYTKYNGELGNLSEKDYDLGIYIESQTSIIDVIDKILDSIWGWRIIDNENKFKFGLFSDPRTATPTFYFDETTIDGNNVEVTALRSVFKNTKLNGIKNNTVLKLNAIPDVLKREQQAGESTQDYNARMARCDFVQIKYKTGRSDSLLDSNYPVAEGSPVDTLIQSEADLQLEADYRQRLSSTPISTIKFVGRAFFEVLPGNVVNVTYKRHGLLSGANVFVTGTERRDMARKIAIEGIFYGEY